jgi:hypothetical protein
MKSVTGFLRHSAQGRMIRGSGCIAGYVYL